jgi:hypothetical protein
MLVEKELQRAPGEFVQRAVAAGQSTRDEKLS